MDIKIELIYFGYIRKSSEDNKERQAASLPEQLYILEGIKSKKSLSMVDMLSESKSAHTSGRPVFNSMLERIEAGEANAILTWHPNRICRNMTDGGKVIDLMDRGKLLEIRTPFRTFHATPEDKWLLTLEFANSKKDSDDKSIAVTRGLEKKNRDGWRPGVAPIGYLNDKATESGFRKILTDPERLHYIKKIFEMYLDDTSVVEIHRIAKDEWHFTTRQKKRIGGKPLSMSAIYHCILGNSFYMGKYEYPVGSGKWHEGSHEKAITEEMFNEVQVRLGKKSKYHLQHHDYPYSSLIPCGTCGTTVCPQEKWQIICTNCKLKFSSKNKDKCPNCQTLIERMKKPTRLHYIYYLCGRKKKVGTRCDEPSVRNDRLEEQIKEKLEMIEISPVFLDWAVRQIEKLGKGETEFEEKKLETLKHEKTNCKIRLDNIFNLKISPANSDGSLLSDEQYKAEKNKIEAELKSIDKQLGVSEGREEEADAKTRKALTFGALAVMRFQKGNSKLKRDIFKGLSGLNLNLKLGLVNFDSPKYIQALSEIKKDVDNIEKRVEPSDLVVKSSQMDAVYASSSNLLRGKELNLVCKIMSLTCTVHYPASCFKIV